MTIWTSDICKCVVDVENNILLIKCSKHGNIAQIEAETRSFNWRLGKGHEFTEQEAIELISDKRIAKQSVTLSNTQKKKFKDLFGYDAQ